MPASQVVRAFLETTSVKGVSKVTKSRAMCLRVTWAVCVLFGLSMTVLLLWDTFRHYFAYQYITNTIDILEAPPFPDITICKVIKYIIHITGIVNGAYQSSSTLTM